MNRQEPEPGDGWFRQVLQRIKGGLPESRKELLDYLRLAAREGLLDNEALGMIEGVIQVADTQVRDVMIPRAQMVAIEHDWETEKIVRTVVESGHSRLPVFGDDRDELQGILLAKDLLRAVMARPGAEVEIRALLRPATMIPESKRLNVLLREFRLSRMHMALVVDEYGGIAGLVTIEDVLEQIVGEIDDEHDVDDERFITASGSGRYMVRALTPIEDFNEEFGVSLSDEEFDTIGGLIMGQLDRLPRRGERIELGPFVFTVLRADRRRVYLLELLDSRVNSGD